MGCCIMKQKKIVRLKVFVFLLPAICFIACQKMPDTVNFYMAEEVDILELAFYENFCGQKDEVAKAFEILHPKKISCLTAVTMKGTGVIF